MTDQLQLLDLQTLRAAVEGDAAAFRCVTELQPAGGTGDKVFPATYEGGTYAFEERMIDGQHIQCVLLDSVQSQANRLELALLDGHQSGKLKFPLIRIDFQKAEEEEVKAVGAVSALEAPHRLADGMFWGSEVEEEGNLKPFRHKDRNKSSRYGQCFEQASTANATPIFELCPTALVFGMWDSYKHKFTGVQGEKFQRALVSEIVGFDAVRGVRPASRIDPVIHTTKDIPIELTDDGWKVAEKGRAKLSEIGLGNVTPSLKNNETGNPHHGGVTIRFARQISVLSLPALRRLQFPVTRGGTKHEDDAINITARTTLAALALAAVSWQWRAGFDLRSRCLLVPQHDLRVELVPTAPPRFFSLPPHKTAELLKEAAENAVAAGLQWNEQPITFHPGRELAKAVRMSRVLEGRK
jgi:CRISPR-associated protein Csb1